MAICSGVAGSSNWPIADRVVSAAFGRHRVVTLVADVSGVREVRRVDTERGRVGMQRGWPRSLMPSAPNAVLQEIVKASMYSPWCRPAALPREAVVDQRDGGTRVRQHVGRRARGLRGGDLPGGEGASARDDLKGWSRAGRLCHVARFSIGWPGREAARFESPGLFPSGRGVGQSVRVERRARRPGRGSRRCSGRSRPPPLGGRRPFSAS